MTQWTYNRQYKLTSGFGMRMHPVNHVNKFHRGLDLVVSPADGPLYAFAAGEVLHAKFGVIGSGFGNMGNVVAIKDPKGFLHVYAHLSAIVVKVGKMVTRGQMIGRQGSTGKSTGPHLHYEIRKKASPSYGWTETEAGVVEPTAYLIDYYADKPVAPAPKPVTPAPAKCRLEVVKRRIIAEGDKLKYISLAKADLPYSKKGTDVRIIEIETGRVRYDFVYAKGKTVSQLALKYNADFAFNGPFLYNGVPLGDLEDQGVRFPNTGAYGNMLKWHELGIVNGVPYIGQLNKDAENWDVFIQGTPGLVENSRGVYFYYAEAEKTAPDIVGRKISGYSVRAQRTFYGIRKGNLVVFIADGRTKSDMGLTIEEMGLLQLDEGIENGVNFDGGRSTIFYIKGLGGINQKLNTGANERAVSHAILGFYV